MGKDAEYEKLDSESNESTNITIHQPSAKEDERPTDARGFTLLLQSLSENGSNKLRQRMEFLLEMHFQEVDMFGCKFRYELIFAFSAMVSILQIVLYGFSFYVLDNSNSKDDSIKCMALSLPASIGVLAMAIKIPGTFNIRKLIFEEFLKDVYGTMRSVGLLMGQEIESRIDEVKLVYRVIGQFITTINVLSDELDKANDRTFSVFDLFTKHFTTIPKPQQIKDYFESVLKPEYTKWIENEIQKEVTMLLKQEEKLARYNKDEEEAEQTRIKAAADKKEFEEALSLNLGCCVGPKGKEEEEFQVKIFAPHWLLEKDPRTGKEKEFKSFGFRALEKEVKDRTDGVAQKKKEVMKEIALNQDKIQKLRKLKTNPRLRVKNFKNHSTPSRPAVYDVNSYLFDMCNVQLFLDKATANSTPWAQKDKGSGETSGPKNGQARIFEEFLELKNEASHSAYLVELDELKKKLHNFEDKLSESDNNVTRPESALWTTELVVDAPVGHRGDRCCCSGPKAEPMDSCRQVVKFTVAVWVCIIVLCQLTYTGLVFQQEKGLVSRDWLAVPLAVQVLCILGLVLIPCYTETDFKKSTKIMEKLLSEYNIECEQLVKDVSRLAAQEKFMGELESIKDNTANATRDVKIWCDDFERSFEFVCSIYESLLFEYEKKTTRGDAETLKYAIEPSIDPYDSALVLTCKDDDKQAIWKEDNEDTSTLLQCQIKNCSVHAKSKHNNEFHVYHLAKHDQELVIERKATQEAIQEIQAAQAGKSNKDSDKMSAQAKKELAARKRFVEKQRADLLAMVTKLEQMLDGANNEVEKLEQSGKEILAAVVAGGGPDKTKELQENQLQVQAKKVERDDLQGELKKKQEELDNFGHDVSVPAMHVAHL